MLTETMTEMIVIVAAAITVTRVTSNKRYGRR
jgi:hypothetical protein